MSERYPGMRKFEDTHVITLPAEDDLEEGDVVELTGDGLVLADDDAERVYVVGKPAVEDASSDGAQVKAREATANVADGVEQGDYVVPDGGEFRPVEGGEDPEESTMQALEDESDGVASVLFG